MDLGFAWALKKSFVEYIAGMPDGRMSIADGVVVTNAPEFLFPYLSSAGTPAGNIVVRFQGHLSFSAHHGLLAVSLRSPSLRIVGDEATLHVSTPGGDVALAEITSLTKTVDGDVVMLQSDGVRLHPDSVDLFGSTYAVGETLAPVTVRIPAAALARTPA